MKIICGTDLSENSRRSVVAANALATRFDDQLDVVHVVHQGIADRMAEAVREMHEQDANEGLAEIAETLDSRGDRSKTHLIHGHADDQLVKLAEAKDVSMVVVGSLGHRDPGSWSLGSCAERVAESCHKPTLIVRDENPFKDWDAEHPLQVFVAWSFDETSENALRWIAKWREYGPCEITVAHVDWPPEEARRLGVRPDYFTTKNDPIVQKVLERDVMERAEAILGFAPDHVVVEGDYSRPDFHFSHIVNERRPDLVVCGTHQRHGLSRLAHTSFSRGLLHNSRSSILMVPFQHASVDSIPRINKVLVATDLSDLGNRAVRTAFAQVRDKGKVYLIHVIDPLHSPSPMVPKYQTKGVSAQEHDQDMQSIKRDLKKLIPAGASELGITTEVHVVEGFQLASAICQCAERYGVDLICLGSHGRGGLSQLVLGSVANSVIARSHRPVTVVKPPES